MQPGVLGLVHDPHAAAAQLLQDPVVGNVLPIMDQTLRVWQQLRLRPKLVKRRTAFGRL